MRMLAISGGKDSCWLGMTCREQYDCLLMVDTGYLLVFALAFLLMAMGLRVEL